MCRNTWWPSARPDNVVTIDDYEQVNKAYPNVQIAAILAKRFISQPPRLFHNAFLKFSFIVILLGKCGNADFNQTTQTSSQDNRTSRILILCISGAV
jgi:hypothetical protein